MQVRSLKCKQENGRAVFRRPPALFRFLQERLFYFIQQRRFAQVFAK